MDVLMDFKLKFNHEKATQVLNFFANKSGGSLKKLKALKLMFFADRYHLRKYGRLISNDQYYAMEYGPVASNSKDIAEQNNYSSPQSSIYAEKFISAENSYIFKSIKTVDFDVFSKSDIEALNFVWNKYGKYKEFDLSELTHKFPEWKKHKSKIIDRTSRIPMNIEDFLLNLDAPEEENDLTLNEQDVEYIKDQLKELSQVESMWS